MAKAVATAAEGRYQYEAAFATKAGIEKEIKRLIDAEQLPESDGAYICDVVDGCPEPGVGEVIILTAHGNKTPGGVQRFVNAKVIPFKT